MQTVPENSTVAYLDHAEPCITMIRSRPVQAYYRLADDLAPPPWWLAQRTDLAKSDAETKPTIERLLLNTSVSGADQTISQLLRLEKLDADWDGNDAAKPLPHSLKDARAFMRSLSPESIIPRPALHADGHAILFVREPDVYAELEFLGNSKISFYARRGGQKWSDEISFDGQSLPEGLSQIGLSL